MPRQTKDFNPTEENLAALREVLFRLRWDNQDGFSGYRGDGKWDFTSTSIPQTTPEELNQLMDLAGIIPDEIKVVGRCEDCKHSINGQERGYKQPCLTCLRPSHANNFEPREE